MQSRFSQNDHVKDPLRIISSTEWQALSLFHSGTDAAPPEHGPSGGPPSEGQLTAARTGIQTLLQIEAATTAPAAAAAAAAGAPVTPPADAAPAANGDEETGSLGAGTVDDANGHTEAAAAAAATVRRAAEQGESMKACDGDGDVVMLDVPEPSAAVGPSGRPARRPGKQPEPQTLNLVDEGTGAVEIISDGGGDEASGSSDPELAYLRKAQARRRASHRSAGPSTANGSSKGGRGGGSGASYGSGMRGVLVTLPGVCEEHLAREARLAREAALVYVDAEVMVEVVRSEEELQAALQPSGGGCCHGVLHGVLGISTGRDVAAWDSSCTFQHIECTGFNFTVDVCTKYTANLRGMLQRHLSAERMHETVLRHGGSTYHGQNVQHTHDINQRTN